MATGPCQECGAPVVHYNGLCDRCYRAALKGRLRAADPAGDWRSVERAWAVHAFTVALMMERPRPGRHTASWRSQAACRDRPDLPWDGNRVSDEMRAVCGACPARDACLTEALAEQVDGVWAATTAAERRRLRTVSPSGVSG